MFPNKLNMFPGNNRRKNLEKSMVEEEDGIKWRPGTHTAGSRRTDPEGVTGRGVNEYAEVITGDITGNARGKRALDLGSGKNAAFARSLTKMLNGDVEVHSLSPEYTDEDLTRLKEFNATRGFAQKLPYPDNHFGFIVGMQVHKHFPDRDHYLRALGEIGRVLAEGGVAYLGPALPDKDAQKLIKEGKTSEEWRNKRGERPKKVEHDTESWVFLYDDAPPTPLERQKYGIPDTIKITKESKIRFVAKGVLGVKTNVVISKEKPPEQSTS